MSGRIFIISTVYAHDRDAEKKNHKRITEWRWKSETENDFLELGYDKTDVYPPFIASRDDKFTLISAEGNVLPYSRMVAKGCALRNKFININKRHAPFKDTDIILYFDGDGQIQESHLFSITNKLKEADFVLSCRGKNFGVSNQRLYIELFENFLISSKTRIFLPDAQCGCWGFKAKYIPKLINFLSAEGFEIELDLLIFFLSNKIKPQYISVDVRAPEAGTTYTATESDRSKLIFLMNKLKLNSTTVQDLYNEFKKKYEIDLPDNYTVNFKHEDVLNMKNNVTKLDLVEIEDSSIKCCLGKADKSHLPKWHICR